MKWLSKKKKIRRQNKHKAELVSVITVTLLNCICSFICRYLASGSGDTTVRFWDVNTETPHFTCKGRKKNLIKDFPFIKDS